MAKFDAQNVVKVQKQKRRLFWIFLEFSLPNINQKTILRIMFGKLYSIYTRINNVSEWIVIQASISAIHDLRKGCTNYCILYK